MTHQRPTGVSAGPRPDLAADPSSQSWDPDAYGKRMSFVHRMAADLVEVLAPKPGERVLDLGCGAGELATAIASAGATVVGLDASPEMIGAARRREPRLEFVVGDGQALDYASEFDAVFSNAALHWMPRAAEVVRGVRRALRPGGRFVAEFGGHRCIAAVREGASEALRRRGEAPSAWLQWYFPPLAEYVALLAAEGFEVRFAHLFDRPTPVEGNDGLAIWLRTFAPRLAEKLGPDWEAFVREVEASCSPSLRHGDRWVLDYVRLRVVACLP
jgi:trans-aconitate methyltransferase